VAASLRVPVPRVKALVAPYLDPDLVPALE
jgi:hypothetical protein